MLIAYHREWCHRRGQAITRYLDIVVGAIFRGADQGTPQFARRSHPATAATHSNDWRGELVQQALRGPAIHSTTSVPRGLTSIAVPPSANYLIPELPAAPFLHDVGCVIFLKIWIRRGKVELKACADRGLGPRCTAYLTCRSHFILLRSERYCVVEGLSNGEPRRRSPLDRPRDADGAVCALQVSRALDLEPAHTFSDPRLWQRSKGSVLWGREGRRW